jgi:hypothetical protein
MARGEGFSKNPKLKLNPAQVKAAMEKFFPAAKSAVVKKTLGGVGGVAKAALRNLPTPSLNAVLSNRKINPKDYDKPAAEIAKKYGKKKAR